MTLEAPPWDMDDKQGSLRRYAEWLHDMARTTFLESGTHVQLFFVLGNDGQGEINPAPPGMGREELAGVLRSRIKEGGGYGMIHIAEANCRLKDNPDVKSEALLVSMESRDGDACCWIAPILRSDDGAALADSVLTEGRQQGTLTGFFGGAC